MEANQTIRVVINTSTTTTFLSWTFTPISVLIISPVAIVLNAYFLIIFIVNKNLHTPFNVYLGNLLFANLLYSVLNNPLDIVNSTHLTWPLSNAACNVYTYSLSALGAMTIHSHALISLNRLLAVTFPVLFKNHHNKKTALYTVICLWAYVHIICLPGIVQDALFYRPSYNDHRCMLNGPAQYAWNMVVQFVIYVTPTLLILLTYPYLLLKHKRRRQVRMSAKQLFSAVSTLRSRHATDEAQGNENAEASNARKVVKEERNRAFLITTMLTLSILVCWAPNVTFYTVASFVQVDSPIGYEIMALLFAIQSVMDPILFALALKDLRTALFAPVPRLAVCKST